MELTTARSGDGLAYAVELVDGDGAGTRPTGTSSDERLTSPTGIRDLSEEGVAAISVLLAHIAGEVGKELSKIPEEHRPTDVEAEICLGLSGQAGPVWLAVKSNHSLRAKLTWKKTDAAEQ
ncbi:hypothetical protein ACGGAQ_30295 [Micromonospora sp. NPDC047557]|uniref:hypothetical protein n=1 Tax=Micromonospora sp. NPDC047557 TaxID=3364250 RepID=UPI003715D8C0